MRAAMSPVQPVSVAQYGIGPSMSIAGGPNALIGAIAFSPSANWPQCAATIPVSFAPEPSGAVSNPATSISSSAADAHLARKNFNTSPPLCSGCAASPPVMMGPTGCTALPHLRPWCTLHQCQIQATGSTKDRKWDAKYVRLRNQLTRLEQQLAEI